MFLNNKLLNNKAHNYDFWKNHLFSEAPERPKWTERRCVTGRRKTIETFNAFITQANRNVRVDVLMNVEHTCKQRATPGKAQARNLYGTSEHLGGRWLKMRTSWANRKPKNTNKVRLDASFHRYAARVRERASRECITSSPSSFAARRCTKIYVKRARNNAMRRVNNTQPSVPFYLFSITSCATPGWLKENEQRAHRTVCT